MEEPPADTVNKRFLPIPPPRADSIPQGPMLVPPTAENPKKDDSSAYSWVPLNSPLLKLSNGDYSDFATPPILKKAKTLSPSKITSAQIAPSPTPSVSGSEYNGFAGNEPINADTALDDPYLGDAIQVLNTFDPHDSEMSSSHVTSRLQKLTMIAWAGGDKIRLYLVHHDIFMILRELFTNNAGTTWAQSISNLLTRRNQAESVHIQILRTYAIMARGSTVAGNRAIEAGWLPVLIKLLDAPEVDLKLWGCHCMFVTMFNNTNLLSSPEEVLASKNTRVFKNMCLEFQQELEERRPKLEKIAKSSRWMTWSYNDANEIMKMMGWSYF
ncbi:hypothetical protein J8273_7395 [Carpediemonas membranifera]|uniref:Uncharacterized protein n=1 Tax=Carpediemonas membranifera TaxID=201153 RepID=A0A8J6DZZ8_9EUKA|nr:hypothetical protein J8273_7395 [Carpediemonas membranifera]|eukprot:KAG9391121.1 hypothetical protein J8273_7395 [Carpediemonas membranifera]